MGTTEARTGQSTERIADFVSRFRLDQLPAELVRVVHQAYLDTIGVALAGSAQQAGERAARYARGQGSGSASVWGQGFSAAPSITALVNGTAAHALDYDDVNWALLGHPSASLVPATIALAETGGFDGHAVVEAYVCGFEVMTKLGRSCMPQHSFVGGWHATGTIGTIGATAACAHLLGLPKERVVNAIGIAVSHSSGVVRNFGSMSKPLHAGLAAQSGIQAATLAAEGFTSAHDAVEGEHGFFSSFSRDLSVDRGCLAELGSRFELDATGLLRKPYPCGVAGHPAIEAAIRLGGMLGPSGLDGIDSIDVLATSYTLDKMRYGWPADELQAKFSLAYQVAAGLVHGTVDLSTFRPDALRDERVRRLTLLVTPSLDKEIDERWRRNGGSRPCRVILHRSDGSDLDVLVEVSKGNPQHPMTEAEMLAKFHDCASLALSPADAQSVADILLDLTNQKDLRELNTLLRSDAGQV